MYLSQHTKLERSTSSNATATGITVFLAWKSPISSIATSKHAASVVFQQNLPEWTLRNPNLAFSS